MLPRALHSYMLLKLGARGHATRNWPRRRNPGPARDSRPRVAAERTVVVQSGHASLGRYSCSAFALSRRELRRLAALQAWKLPWRAVICRDTIFALHAAGLQIQPKR